MQIKRITMPATNFPVLTRKALKQAFIFVLGALLIVQSQAAVGFAQQAAQNSRPSTSQVASKDDPSPPNVASSPDELPSAPEPQSSSQLQQPQSAQQQNAPQQPVGTAAAPYEKPTGVPGSRPAGAAIAPARQRRVRAIVIRVALVLAGAGAVGAVVGLSKASHSQP